MDAGTGGARTNGVAAYGEENWKRVWDMGLTSHWRGVSWSKRKRAWQAVHRADGVLRSVPCACERDAALMYNDLVVRYQHNKLDDDSGVELLAAPTVRITERLVGERARYDRCVFFCLPLHVFCESAHTPRLDTFRHTTTTPVMALTMVTRARRTRRRRPR